MNKNCYGCKHSGMGPGDEYLVCYNADAGAGPFFGTYVKGETSLRGILSKCGVELKLFEQHPAREPDGKLKP